MPHKLRQQTKVVSDYEEFMHQDDPDKIHFIMDKAKTEESEETGC